MLVNDMSFDYSCTFQETQFPQHMFNSCIALFHKVLILALLERRLEIFTAKFYYLLSYEFHTYSITELVSIEHAWATYSPQAISGLGSILIQPMKNFLLLLL